MGTMTCRRRTAPIASAALLLPLASLALTAATGSSSLSSGKAPEDHPTSSSASTAPHSSPFLSREVGNADLFFAHDSDPLQSSATAEGNTSYRRHKIRRFRRGLQRDDVLNDIDSGECNGGVETLVVESIVWVVFEGLLGPLTDTQLKLVEQSLISCFNTYSNCIKLVEVEILRFWYDEATWWDHHRRGLAALPASSSEERATAPMSDGNEGTALDDGLQQGGRSLHRASRPSRLTYKVKIKGVCTGCFGRDFLADDSVDRQRLRSPRSNRRRLFNADGFAVDIDEVTGEPQEIVQVTKRPDDPSQQEQRGLRAFHEDPALMLDAISSCLQNALLGSPYPELAKCLTGVDALNSNPRCYW